MFLMLQLQYSVMMAKSGHSQRFAWMTASGDKAVVAKFISFAHDAYIEWER
jgi:hypothetical protein